MLLIKCPQCNRSYRLAESLYRRKAAGFGVVVTCRHCKTQIHVDEGVVPTVRHAGDPMDLASEMDETDETDVPSLPDIDIPEPPPSSAAGRAMPLVVKASSDLITPVITELDAPTIPPLAEVTELEAPTLPPARDTDTHVLPPVAPRAGGVPRPGGGIPRPGGVPRPGASATGTPLPLQVRTTTSGTTLGLGRPLASATATPLPGDGNTPTPSGNGAKPKIVALSPGLLGVKTALKGGAAGPGAAAANATSATATPLGLSPTLPKPAPTTPLAAKAAAAEESAPISSAPMSLPDSELFAIDAEEPPPDSTMPIDTVDYLESVRPVAPVLPKGYAREVEAEDDPEKTPIPQARDKRLPHAPPVPHPPHPHARDEGADGAKRKRLPSGDLTDDLLSGDLGFDAPALAPPDASALMRAPVSVRPSGSASMPASGSTKAPVSKTTSAPAQKKGGRGLLYALVLAACGSAGYFWTHRVEPPATPEHATLTPPPTEPSPPPVAEPPSATAAEVASAAPEASDTAAVASAAPAEAAPTTTSETASAPAPTAAATSVAAAPAEKTTKSHTEATTSTSTKPASTGEEQATAAPKPTATAPAPTSTAALEPRGSAGTDPFDVAAARTALESTAAQASSCRKEGDPSGLAIVTITFSQTGRVTTAQISGPPFQATPTGGCIASTMRKTRVPPFAGEMVTVRKTVTIQ